MIFTRHSLAPTHTCLPPGERDVISPPETAEGAVLALPAGDPGAVIRDADAHRRGDDEHPAVNAVELQRSHLVSLGDRAGHVSDAVMIIDTSTRVLDQPPSVEATGAVLALHAGGPGAVIRDADARRRDDDEHPAVNAVELQHSHVVSLGDGAERASDAVMVIDTSTRVLDQSPSVEAVLGHIASEVVGYPLSRLLHADDVVRTHAWLGGAMISHRRSAPIEVRMRARDGRWRFVEMTASDRRGDAPGGGFVVGLRDVSERKMLEDQLTMRALIDPLTTLANRAQIENRLDHLLTRPHGSAAMIFLDLDDFRVVNDSLGHRAGDELLVQVARRLERCAGPDALAARFGGDQFGILLKDADSQDVTDAAAGVLEALSPPFQVAGRDIFVQASLGVALGRAGETRPDALLREADTATYFAKRHGRGRYEVYDQAMHGAMIERLDLLNDLHQALDRGELLLHYQPIVLLATGEIAGVEALVRWQHPTRGLLLPERFVPLAEESGAIIPLGRWVLEEACRRARRWQDEFAAGAAWTVSVNVSAGQLLQGDFVAETACVLHDCGLDPGRLVLEITESVMAQGPGAIHQLQGLKALGVRLAIDDFGTGYSSLRYLRQCPFDMLRIDRTFVAASAERPRDQALTRAIVEIAKILQLEVIAEGIEQPEQCAQLRSFDCHLGQGYYFSGPLEPEAFEALMRRPSSAPQATAPVSSPKAPRGRAAA